MKMPKFSPKHGNEWDGKNWGDRKKPTNWGVETIVIDADSKLVHGGGWCHVEEEGPYGGW